MKIMIVGYSCSGKFTLTEMLASKYKIACLHLDQVQFLPGWVVRNAEEKNKILNDFLNNNVAWVMDGNYFSLSYERRVEEADLVVVLKVNRFKCLWRAVRRYLEYHNQSRPSMAEECEEKLDLEFVKWILYKGRKPSSITYLETYHDKSKLLYFSSRAKMPNILAEIDRRMA